MIYFVRSQSSYLILKFSFLNVVMADSFFYLSCQPPWEEYFTYLALGVSMRSKDPKTQVGCVIVDTETLKVSIFVSNQAREFKNYA